MKQAAAISMMTLLIVGCDSMRAPSVDPPTSRIQPVELNEVAFYVAGMNEQLKIL